MPFRRRARVTITSDLPEHINLAYQITYAQTEVPDGAGYLHAQWRRAVTDRANPDYVILDEVRGHGRYVGTFLSWSRLSQAAWFGEGEIKIFIDGDDEFPTT